MWSEGDGKSVIPRWEHGHTGGEEAMETGIEEIRRQSRAYPRVENLMRNMNRESLIAMHLKQPEKKAKGVDGIGKAEYSKNLEGNIANLLERMKRFSYRPLPVRRTYIPKANGKMRPLGIPSYEDRLVQGVMADILNAVYEERFLDCSYGFRAGRSAHDVVRIIQKAGFRERVNYVLEADIKGFFDNVDHDWLIRFLEHDIADKNLIRYIKRFLIAGVMEGTQLQDSDKGTPQGGLISPVLANVYLHYVLDLWFEKAVKPRLIGYSCYVRYADDFLILFENRDDAERVLEAIRVRMEKFSLELAEEKTKILPFGRLKGTRECFDFLGFTFSNSKTRTGYYRVQVSTSKKKLKAKRQAVKEWLRGRMHKPIDETMRLLNLKLQGHCNYYGVNGNLRAVCSFYVYVKRRLLVLLRHRSQKDMYAWEKLERIWKHYITPPTIKVQIWG